MMKEELSDTKENSSTNNQILVQSQIDLNPEDIMVIKIFSQVNF